MNLQEITPMILCYNERENIERSLQRLTWAKRILVLDEGSTDGTLEICRKFLNVEVECMPRGLSLAEKCNRGLQRITSEWTLSLDSDYMLTEAFIRQLQDLEPPDETMAYQVPFKLEFFGIALPNTLYPPRSLLYRGRAASYIQDGHAHRVKIQGTVSTLNTPIIHDDRKSLERWFHSQSRYAREEAEKLSLKKSGELSAPDRLRRMIIVAPVLVFFWTYFIKGMARQGGAGVYYTLMRVCAEIMLSLALLDKKLRKWNPPTET